MLGYTEKMHTRLENPVQYHLPLNDQKLALNERVGTSIKFRFTGQIRCVHCSRTIKKSFNQGYCYPCFVSLAQCDMCIMKPETCHYEAGTCREPTWGEQFCFQPHIVYLANSSGIKVGITRHTQIPTRWIDQGAVQALPIFKVQSRYISGLLEIAIGKHISDKTNWQQMLKNHAKPVDLAAKKDELVALCSAELAEILLRFGNDAIQFLADEQAVEISYPLTVAPARLSSFNLDKSPDVAGVLLGIKGQYLLLDTGVINIRKYAGYELDFSV